MRILYGIQLNGNGHITRSLEIIKCLKDVGFNVDILVSGKNSNINIPYQIKYKSTGLSIYYNKRGYVNWFKTFTKLRIFRLLKDIRSFDCQNYDLVISDFEPITAWSAKRQGVKSLNISNQKTLLLDINKRKSYFSRLFIKYFAPCDYDINLHYKSYIDTTQPVISEDLLTGPNKKRNKIVIYLPSISLVEIVKKIRTFKNTNWVVFTDEIEKDICINNIQILKIDRSKFKKHILSCYGVITASGFSTTSEALVLRKMLWSIPLKGQYEQMCNADFLKDIGVFTEDFTKDNLKKWLSEYKSINYDYKNPIPEILDEIINLIKNKNKIV